MLILAVMLACRPAVLTDTFGPDDADSASADSAESAEVLDDLPPAATEPENPAVCFSELSRYEGEELLVYDLAWSPDGRRLATGSVNLLRLYDVSEDGSLTLLDSVYSEDRFNSIQWSADGALVYAPTGTHLMVFDASADKLRLASRGQRHTDDLQRVSLSPDGRLLLSCDVAGVTRLYDVTQAPSMSMLDAAEVHERCTRVAWSPDGAQALSTGHDGDFVLYAVEDRALAVTDRFAAGEETGEAIFGRDATEAIGGSFGDINDLWYFEVDAGRLIERQRLEGHASGIGALEWSHSGEYLLTGAHDHTMHVLERAPDGQGLQVLSDHPDDGGGVHSARWSPDDSRVARTGSSRDLLVIYDVVPCP